MPPLHPARGAGIAAASARLIVVLGYERANAISGISRIYRRSCLKPRTGFADFFGRPPTQVEELDEGGQDQAVASA